MISYKNTGLKVMDIDEQHKKVQMYVSSFNVLDSDNDVVMPGAYKKTIKESGPLSERPRIKHLRDHYKLVGKPLEMVEDEKGLLVTSQVSNSTAGRDLMEDYKLDMFEHSIGYEVIRSESGNREGTTNLLEIKLWEYSSVTWGANEDTPTIAVSKAMDDDYLKRLNDRMDRCIKALRVGNYSDERYEDIELQLRFMQKSYNDMISSLKKPLDSTGRSRESSTLDDEPSLAEIGDIFDNFKSKVENGKS